jgi:hypothetical protein
MFAEARAKGRGLGLQSLTIVVGGLQRVHPQPLKRHTATFTYRGSLRGSGNGEGTMRDDGDKVCNLNFASALKRRHSTWRNAQRHRNAVAMLARQIAFMEVGQEATANEFAAYLKQHRARLTAEAEYIIASRAGLARWRLPRR